VVTAIAAQSRAAVQFAGMAGHAGTVPMELRQDALCAAAEFILYVERCRATATVGMIDVEPGASNVIPGVARLSVDVRDLSDARRRAAVEKLRRLGAEMAADRGVSFAWETVQESASVACDAALTRLLSAAVKRQQGRAIAIPSGAGHDAAAMSALCPVAMLFVRCKDGLSHHPAESVKTTDVQLAIAALHDFVLQLAARHA
jgi:allantoate deiminase